MIIRDANRPSIHCQTAGQGETIVFIHGLGANLAFWFMSVGRLLAREYRVITYDLRGHGKSSMPANGYRLPQLVDDLEFLLDELDVDKAHFVGHSFGARVALAESILNADRVASLTIADTQAKCLQDPVMLGEWDYWPIWRKQLTEQGHQNLPGDHELITFQLLAYFNNLAPDFTAGGLGKRRRSPSLRSRDMGKRGAQRWQRLIEGTSAQTDFAHEDPLSVSNIKNIQVPTLAVYGEYSHCLDTCWRLRELVTGCRVSIVPEAGHFHPAIRPRRFARTLRGFFRAQKRRRQDIAQVSADAARSAAAPQ
jgi:pimeloyl-ACP methyl ester carboxylesterase